ncbi:hypothetical protein HN51_008494 [Arachis hypogaea]
MDSHRDIEGTQADHSESNNSIFHSTGDSHESKYCYKGAKQGKCYGHDNKTSKDLDEALATPDNIGHALDLPLSFNNTKANFSNGISDDDLQTQNLDQVLWQNDDNSEKSTNCIERKDSDRKYIAEMLLTSGLLSSPSLI